MRRRRFAAALGVGLVAWCLASMGPAGAGWRELRFVHALTWSHLLGLRCGWCVEEALALNSGGDAYASYVAPRPVAEAAMGAAWDKASPFVIRGALPRTPWTAAGLAADDDVGAATYSFQCAANVSSQLREGGFAGYGCAVDLPLREGLARGFYMRQNNRLLRDFPSLGENMGLTEAFLASLDEGHFSLKGVFLGSWDGVDPASPARGSSLHSDLSANWYAQKAGDKTWTLVSPDESARLLPVFDERRGVPALFSGLGYAADATDDERRRPLEAVPRFVVTLGVGDLLYVPSWWWHQIENAPGFNAAVALRGPKSVVAALRPSSPAFFATVGSLPDIALQTRNLLATKLGVRTGSFEDAFLREAKRSAAP